jgi:hypothetical protein
MATCQVPERRNFLEKIADRVWGLVPPADLMRLQEQIFRLFGNFLNRITKRRELNIHCGGFGLLKGGGKEKWDERREEKRRKREKRVCTFMIAIVSADWMKS